MFYRRFRRSLTNTRIRRSRWPRVLLLTTIVFVLIDIINITHSGSPSTLPAETLRPDTKSPDRIFIASIHWNNEAILRSHWNNALLDLVRTLGAANVYVAIFESGSWDNSKGALRELDAELEKLGVEKKVVLDETTHVDEIERTPSENEPGWIWTTRGKKELRRIPYLSRMRNQALDELGRLAARKDGKGMFDKTIDVLTLLGTRDGDYAAACSLDFARPPAYYDTFALRDDTGSKPITQTWPYFLSYKSRHALMSSLPVPVRSCWSGMVAFDAVPFYQDPMLRFRGIPDSLALYHLEGSECCLIHADNYLSAKKGVWLNPEVRVGYSEAAYKLVHPTDSTTWPLSGEKILGIYFNRVVRLTNWPKRRLEAVVIWRRLSSWSSNNKPGMKEVGVYCLINEMQVLISNGWAHL
ncbi:hypothetical protein FQN57_001951 [Myotisia sp. PD_48]|nr:hypothetical protein FQN57_001951 [Myotisia sp. PD_48]